MKDEKLSKLEKENQRLKARIKELEEVGFKLFKIISKPNLIKNMVEGRQLLHYLKPRKDGNYE